MDLQTYLTKSSSRPNKQILQSLGATEEQIEYIMETPKNFNWNVFNSFVDGGNNEDDDVMPEVKTIFVNQDGSLEDGSELNSAKDIYEFLEEYGPDYLNVLDSEFYQFEFDYKDDDTYYYIYDDGQYKFQITITNSKVMWYQNVNN